MTEYAEDTPHASGDYGPLVLFVRNDGIVDLTSTDGDRSGASVDRAGRLHAIASGEYDATSPTLTDGARQVLQLNAAGDLLVAFSGNSFSTAGVTGSTIRNRSGGNIVMGVANTVFNGTTFTAQRSANVFKPFNVTAVTAGTPVTLWTPTSTRSFRLMGLQLSSSVAAQLILKAGDTVILRSPLLEAGKTWDLPTLGNGILSTAADAVLSVDTTASGNVAGSVWGVEE